MSDESGRSPGSWTTASQAAPSPKVITGGRKLGRYRLCAELASGGMGTVHLALTEGPHGFEKLVALKSIHPHLANDPRFVSMFLDEARIAARLSHPNACGVIDFGESDGTYYLTMPFLMGEALNVVQRALRKSEDAKVRADSPFVIARLLADACEGLHAAHELRDDRGTLLNVVHRDISPQNLFVGFEGTMTVLDFGVASARQRLHSTATGEVKGKFAYACPEQLESRELDRRADVWSLGVVLWEHVTLKKLFARRDVAATIKAVLTDPIPPLRELAPDASLGLEEIVARALARDPDRRFATAREMGMALLDVLAEEGRTVGPPHVATWLEALMPTARADKERLVERARAESLFDAVVGDAAPSPSSAANVPGARPTSDAPTVAGTPTAPDPSDVSVLVTTAPTAGRRGVWVAAGLALAVALAAGLVWQQRTPPEAAPIAAASNPASNSTSADSDSDSDSASESDSDSESESESESESASESASASASDSEPDSDSTSDSEPPSAFASPSDSASAPPSEPATTTTTTTADLTADPAADRTRARGRVAIAIPNGWALVHHQSRLLGEAPGTFTLPTGNVVLRIQFMGRGAGVRRRVRVRANQTTRIEVPMPSGGG